MSQGASRNSRTDRRPSPERRAHDLVHGDGVQPASHRLRPGQTFSDELIEEARRHFQMQTGRTLTAEDGRQILENLTGYFSALHDGRKAVK